jgi:predicted RND superfamily exporter protein
VALACAARQTPTREEPVDWVREALARCGPASAASCLAGVATGVALGFASERFLKEFGLGVAGGLTLELLVVQFLMAPALLRLTYRRPRDQ